MRAEETLRSVVVGIFNDFLDGDLEMVRTLLRKSPHTSFVTREMTMRICLGGINDLSPSLRLGDEGIDSILLTLQGLRDRVLSKFTHCLLPTQSHKLAYRATSLPRPYAHGDFDTLPSP